MSRPQAADEFAKISLNNASHEVAGNILANESDASGNPVCLRFVDGIRVGDKGVDTILGSYGTFTFRAGGSYTYSLDSTNPDILASQHGQILTESLDFRISDGLGVVDFGPFKLIVEGPNQRPVASNHHVVFDPIGISTVTSGDAEWTDPFVYRVRDDELTHSADQAGIYVNMSSRIA